MLVQVEVGLSDIEVIQGGGKLVVQGIGSGVGVIVFDPVKKVAGGANILLPRSRGKDDDHVGRYANTAVPHLIELMSRLGADTTRLEAVVAGGAALFSGDQTEIVNFGSKTAKAVGEQLEAIGAKTRFKEVGGHGGREIALDLGTNTLYMTTAQYGERQLGKFNEVPA